MTERRDRARRGSAAWCRTRWRTRSSCASTSTSRHPLYAKTMRHQRKFYAHDADNTCKVGDVVRIAETRPMSKLKRWRVVEVVEKARE